MQFVKFEKTYSKLNRAFALLLAIVLMCSVLVVGDVAEAKITDNAVASSVYGGRLYFDFSVSDWSADNAYLAVWHWGDSGGVLNTLTHLAGKVYYVDLPSNTSAFKLLRGRDPFTDGSTAWPSSYWNKTGDCFFGGENSSRKSGQDVFRPTTISSDVTGKDNCIWYKYGSPSTTNYGNNLTASNGFSGNSSVVGVPAVFYDYYTDYERDNGWRSVVVNKNGEQASRTYANSFPFDGLNSYISGIAGSSSWELPLYFGNFYTEDEVNANEHAYGYDYSGNIGFTRSTENFSPPLAKFSNQANNSMYLNAGTYAPDGMYSKYSMAGLANNSLNNSNQLTMGTGSVVAPYFDDRLVTDNYATKVTTQFPMRVVDMGTYKKYIYDSNRTFGEEIDNAYLSDYGTSNFQMNYSASAGATDAHMGFGSDSNGSGFFPFEENGSGDAYDFGFGMRLDIPFTLTLNGKVPGGSEDIKFRFCGDDDVWVYVDGKLALDLGGDHQKAQGEINFATEQASIATGVYTVLSGNNYGNPPEHAAEKPRFNQTSANVANPTVDLSSVIDKSDPTRIHKLTLFYMERGMSESNLSMEFTMTPATNKLLTTKTVDTGNVNDAIKSDNGFKNAIANESFGLTYKENGSNATRKFTVGDSTTLTSLNSGKTTIKDGADYRISFDEQFVTGNTVEVVEDTASAAYKYTTTVAVTDEYLRAAKSSVTSVDNGAGFVFKTDSANANAPTIIKTAFTNTVKTGKVKVAKTYSGSQAGDFTFKVEAKVPGSSSYITLDNSYTVSKNGEGTYITGIPLGSDVRITETTDLTNFRTPSFTLSGGTPTSGTQPANGVNFTLDSDHDDVTVTCTNTDVVREPEILTIPVKKTVNGSNPTASDPSFQFNITEVDASGNTKNGGYSASATTALSGGEAKATFSITINEATTRYFKIEERNISSPYSLDTSVASRYFVKIISSETATSYSSSITKYKNAINGDQLSAADVITFNNTKPTTGSIVFTKVDEDLEALQGAHFALYREADVNTSTGSVNSDASAVATAVSGSNGEVEFTDVTAGRYYIVETKAPDGYELYGRLIGQMIDGSVVSSSSAVVSSTEPIEVQAGIQTYGTGYLLKNVKSTNLPQTGGVGVVVLIAGGLVLIALGIYMLKTDNKDEKTK